MGCRGINLLHHCLHHGLQGNVLSFFTDFYVCRVISLTYSHFSLHLQMLWYRVSLLEQGGNKLSGRWSLLNPAFPTEAGKKKEKGDFQTEY